VLFENAHVRVLDTRINPGQRTPVHTHRWPAAHYIVSWSDFVRRDADGTVLLDTRKTDHARVGTPEALWGDALPPHSLENVGTVPLHIISTEVKSAADPSTSGGSGGFGVKKGWAGTSANRRTPGPAVTCRMEDRATSFSCWCGLNERRQYASFTFAGRNPLYQLSVHSSGLST
jgi:mannose-6-phosphate isomerase-like protein (cupin superfamily)